jgi:hypothetical protein
MKVTAQAQAEQGKQKHKLSFMVWLHCKACSKVATTKDTGGKPPERKFLSQLGT